MLVALISPIMTTVLEEKGHPTSGTTTSVWVATAGVPSGFVNVAVRLAPAEPPTATLVVPVSESDSSVGPPGVMLYVTSRVDPGLAVEASAKMAFPSASSAHVTASAGAGCVCISAG